ncbi:Chromatin modification- protein meaf6 [Cladochytrium tenue]|nr:Chromatin modification- protein meaf6 [Cladochytrium tenue]
MVDPTSDAPASTTAASDLATTEAGFGGTVATTAATAVAAAATPGTSAPPPPPPPPPSGLPATPQDAERMLADAERELLELLNRKKHADKALSAVEAHIYTYEGSYLEDSLPYGNVVRGFDGFLAPRPAAAAGGGMAGGAAARAAAAAAAAAAANSTPSRGGGGARAVSDADRIFSSSSASFAKSLDARLRDPSEDDPRRASPLSAASSAHPNGGAPGTAGRPATDRLKLGKKRDANSPLQPSSLKKKARES